MNADLEQEYYKCLEDISRKYNITILVHRFEKFTSVVPIYDRERDELRCLYIIFPPLDVFLKKEIFILKKDVPLHEVVEQVVMHELNHVKDFNYGLKHCRELFLHHSSVFYIVDEFKLQYLFDLKLIEKYGLLERMKNHFLQHVIPRVSTLIPGILYAIMDGLDALSGLLNAYSKTMDEKLRKKIILTADLVNTNIRQILSHLFILLVFETVVLNVNIVDVLKRVGLYGVRVYEFSIDDLFIEVYNFVKRFLTHLDVCRGTMELVNILRKYLPNMVYFEELYSKIFGPTMIIINLSMTKEEFWEKIKRGIIKIFKPR